MKQANKYSRALRLGILPAACVAIAVGVAGCGSGSSAPKPTSTPLPVATVTSIPSTGIVRFGTSVSLDVLIGRNTVFNKPKTLGWLAHMVPGAAAGHVTITVVRTNGPGQHPRRVWTETLKVKTARSVASQLLTQKELKAHQITPGGDFEFSVSQAGKTLATGTVRLASGSSGSNTGY